MARIQIQPAAHGVSQQQPAVDNGNNNQLLPKSLYVGALDPNVNIQPAAHGVSQQQPAVDNGNNNQLLPKSLYVGELDPNVNEAQLYDIFCQIGPVLTVYICRDANTNNSLGYGYVYYNSGENAREALRGLNSTSINGNPIRIMYSPHDPSIRSFGSAKIFVSNLDKRVSEYTFYRTFAMCGPILCSNIKTDASGKSKGYGFVIYEHEEAAQNAIKYLDGQFIYAEKVYVGPFRKKEQRERENGNNNVFVRNLSEWVNGEDLRNYFGMYGTITSATVIRDAAGNSKCFGFVNFENADAAANCIENHKIDGEEWYVEKALTKSELRRQYGTKFQRKYGTNLYLENLDDSIDDTKLIKLFSNYGTITSCKVIRDFHGQSKGSGFVAFSTPSQACLAMMEMNGKLVAGKHLYVALAKRAEKINATISLPELHNSIGTAE